MENISNNQKIEYDPLPEGVRVTQSNNKIEVSAFKNDKLKLTYHIFVLLLFVASSRFLSAQTPAFVWIMYGLTVAAAAWSLAEIIFSQTNISIGSKAIKFQSGFGFFTKKMVLPRHLVKAITLNSLKEKKEKQLVFRMEKIKHLRFGEDLSNRVKTYIRAVITRELNASRTVT